jgi:hypothetical protein
MAFYKKIDCFILDPDKMFLQKIALYGGSGSAILFFAASIKSTV